MTGRTGAVNIDHPLIDFHTHVRGSAPLTNISPNGLLYSLTGLVADITEPLLYKVVRQIAYHLRDRISLRLMDQMSGIGLHEIQRLFNKHNLDELVKSMDENGIERSVILAIEPYLDVGGIVEVIEPHQERFHVFGSLKPGDPKGLESLRYWIEAGRIVGLKLHVVQELPPAGQAMFEVCSLANSYGIPVMFHAGTFPFRRPEHRVRDYDEHVGALEPLIAAFPKLVIILGHVGWDQWRTVLQLGRTYANVYTETSWQPNHVIREAIEALGVERVLFGSDFPLFKQREALQTVYYALGRSQFRMVTFENARRLLEQATRAARQRASKVG